MKLPHGIHDFEQLITEDYFYADRTSYIREVEEEVLYMVFLRPPGFGKSLLLSMLENYYDVARADQFERLFGHLAIGQQPTAKHNQYIVLKWDLAAIDLRGDAAAIRASLHRHVNDQTEAAMRRYRDLLRYEVSFDPTNALYSLQSFLSVVNLSKQQVYLLIDNHDALAQAALQATFADDPQRAEALREAVWALRPFFANAKSSSGDGAIAKIVITGAIPSLWGDVGDAFNIALDVHQSPGFWNVCGFSTAEMTGMLQSLVERALLPASAVAATLEEIEATLGGYAFDDRQPTRVIHPALALQLIQRLEAAGQAPPAVAVDYQQQAQQLVAVLTRTPEAKKRLGEIIKQGSVHVYHAMILRFGTSALLERPQGMDVSAALLYYFGLLTEGSVDAYGLPALHIPNKWARDLVQAQLA